jgi:hypothetical protein
MNIENLSKPSGIFKIQNTPSQEGLRCLLKKGKVEAIEGSLDGVDCHLRSSAEKLQGKIVIDYAQIASLLPKKWETNLASWKLGKKWVFEGEIGFNPFVVEGTIRGKDVEVLGYLVSQITGDIFWEDNQLTLHNFKILDPALSLSLPHFQALQTADSWEMQCSLLEMRNFRPSHLRSREKSGESKPFIVESLNFYSLKGDLMRPSSWTGSGDCSFSNHQEKESHFLDQPLSFFKNLGVDPHLLTPICGNALLKLEAGKCSFYALKEAYSEGKRCQFFLNNEGESYIDIQGNLHIDLKMKQMVPINLLESFTLMIRGSVAEPRYRLYPKM